LLQAHNFVMARNDKKAETEAPEPASVVHDESPKELFARMDAMGADPIFPDGRRGSDLAAAMQASPDKKISLEPERCPMPVRDVPL
jgi:hypothetical protein